MTLLTTTDDGVQVADFQFGFTLGEKAMVASNEEDGSVLIEGLASDFGLDRQDEAFEPGAFERGLKAYMNTNPILLYHHKSDTALGQVLDASITPEGLHVKARVDAPEPGTLIADYVRKIKNGTLRAFSVGGRFKRRMTPNGPRIFDCDLAEVSITPYPVNPRTIFAVAGKAFEAVETPEAEEDQKAMDEFEARLERIDAMFTDVEGKAKKSTAKPTSPQTNRNFPPGQGHPDAAPVAQLLMHVQKIHQLAENTAQNAADPEVADVAKKAATSLKKHSQSLHHIAARIGPLPDYYGPMA